MLCPLLMFSALLQSPFSALNGSNSLLSAAAFACLVRGRGQDLLAGQEQPGGGEFWGALL